MHSTNKLLVCLGVTMVMLLAVILANNHWHNLEMAEKERSASTLKLKAGAPAPESEISDNSYYRCDSSLWEIQFNPKGQEVATNYFVVLQEYGRKGNGWVIVGNRRFFKVSQPLVSGQNTLWRSQRGG